MPCVFEFSFCYNICVINNNFKSILYTECIIMWHKYKQISFITCQPSINHLENSKLGHLSGVTYLCLPQKEQGVIARLLWSYALSVQVQILWTAHYLLLELNKYSKMRSSPRVDLLLEERPAKLQLEWIQVGFLTTRHHKAKFCSGGQKCKEEKDSARKVQKGSTLWVWLMLRAS